jgi:hypothetical protein
MWPKYVVVGILANWGVEYQCVSVSIDQFFSSVRYGGHTVTSTDAKKSTYRTSTVHIHKYIYITKYKGSVPMSRIDDFINKRIPGSMPLKAFVAAVLVCSVVAYPVFSKPPEESRQGHDYMSSDKPEAIRATQEQLRKQYRQKRKQAEAEQEKKE